MKEFQNSANTTMS